MVQEKLVSSEKTKNDNNVYHDEPQLQFDDNSLWEEYQFEELFEIKNGLNKGKDYFGYGIPILNYMDVNKNIYNTKESIKGLVDVDKNEIKRYNVKPNDLFFTRTSETSDEIGLTSAYTGELMDCVFSGFILRARPIKEDINSLFFAYYLRSDKSRSNIIKYSSITTRALISGSNLYKMKVRMPKIDEQNKIAGFLSAIDKKIELLEKKYNEKLIFKEEFFNKYISSLSKETQKIKLNNLIKILNDRNKNNDDLEVLSISNKLGFISQEKQFEDRIVASSDTKNYKIVKKGYFAYNPARINVGSIARLKNYDEGIISPMYIVFKINEDLINPIFFENYLSTNYFKLEILKRLEGSVRLILSAESLKNIEIFIPPLDEQDKISSFMITLTKNLELSKIELDNFKEFKKGLLQKMFI